MKAWMAYATPGESHKKLEPLHSGLHIQDKKLDGPLAAS